MPDMSHTAVQARLQAAFDAAIAVPTYRSEGDRWTVHVNDDVLVIFGADDLLVASDIVPRFAEHMRLKFPKSQWSVATTIVRHWTGAGNLLHWALRFGLVAQEAGADGVQAWRLVRREATYIVDEKHGWAVRQVRGLPPLLQAAQDRKEATRRRLNATLDRRARDKADDRIRSDVAAILRLEPDFLVEERAMTARLPEICHGRRLAEVVPIVVEAHHRLGMNRPTLKSWMRHLDHRLFMLRVQGPLARRAPPPPPGPAEIPAEDEAALGALA